ncbi:MAG: peptidase M16 domain-containing protein [Parcubacteria group bacterium Gr01-1014_18]|nr:MAG: peptidase M16 domain-containing protein [Parcubacteria group bacterium Greene0416_36]TSC80965.1 MAG: peptidase M16 domain-containing protein [Parcubacteria group bacterium Gr01-1014_18]TSC98852.1 MAG: peptidase M16 domain-containing protein [Parcubacteria group bacterium Greene1014_20]TSD06562.1 MAG: peptidase M16 domain-containing protein [Parcubacteria group bacterium Greene0714_2]
MFIKHILPNAVRLVLVPMKDSQSVTALVLVKAGSRYEKPETGGISHFIEHMMFKGTKRFPTTLDLTRILDGVGADFNAYTAKDHTGYYIKLSATKIELALDLLSEMFLNSTFDQAALDRERGVIIEEIKMYEDTPNMHIYDVFESAIYGKTTHLGRNIAGTKETVSSLSRADMMNYIASRYQGDQMVIVLAGKVDENTIPIVEKYFSPISGNLEKLSTVPKFDFETFSVSQTKPSFQIETRKTEQVQLGFGFPGLSLLDPRLGSLRVLSVILGGSMSSRLFINVREKMGFCYFIRSEPESYQDAGSFGIFAGLDQKNVARAVGAISKELKDIKEHGVQAEELSRAKEYIEGKMTLRLENTSSVASFFGDQELLENRMSTPSERLAEIRAVTLEDVRAIAQEIFVRSRTNIALVGKKVSKADLMGGLDF